MAELGTWEDPASVIPGGEFVDAHTQRRTPVTARVLNSMITGVRGVRTTIAVLIGEVNQIAADLAATMDDYVPQSRQILPGDGMTGGGDLTVNRSLSVAYGTTVGTATQGNDERVVNAIQKPAGLALGDLLVGAAGNVVSRLAKASDGYVLKLAGGVPAWAPEGAGSVAWTEATLNTMFAWYATETDALRLAYSKVGDRVYIQGEFRAIAGATDGTTLFTLPADMRPTKVIPMPGWISTSSNPNTTRSNNRNTTIYTAHPDGTVKTPTFTTGYLGGMNTSFPLR